jgi:hypothetical protein
MGRAAALAVLGLVAAAACTPTDQPPGQSPTSSPSTGGQPSAAPSSPAATDADTGAAATRSLARYLTDNGYSGVTPGTHSVRYRIDADRYTVTITCSGGLRHEPGWVGLCAGTSKGEPPYVIPARVTSAVVAEAYAMSTDDAAYCGGDEAPAWVQAVLKKASDEYCFLREGDG